MGCQSSKIAKCDKNDNPQNGGAVTNDTENTANLMTLDESAAKGLTERQKELVGNTWKTLVENISNVGVITFMNLFETHPDVQDVFMPFKGLSQEELKHSTELRAHGLRVMGSVQKVVARLDEPEKAENLLKELGRNHVMYGAKIDYVDLIGPQFIFAVKPSLETYWSEETEEAWLQLFRYVAYVMKKAMIERINSPMDAKEDSKNEICKDVNKDIKKNDNDS